jgi:hypothetical protein
MFLFHDHPSDNPCKFSQVAEQTQQKGRRSINTWDAMPHICKKWAPNVNNVSQ